MDNNMVHCLRFPLVLALLLTGLSTTPALAFAAPKTVAVVFRMPTTRDDDVRIAVFTFQFHQAYSGRPAKLPYYFLCGGFSGKYPYDPDRAILGHFTGSNPPVYGISRALEFTNPAVGCKINLVKWISPTVVHVNAEMFPVDGTQIDFATGYTYYLSLKDGIWIVTKHTIVWIE